MTYEIHTDGSCSHNPGPGSYCYVILDDQHNIIEEAYGCDPDTTNNRMELMAVLEALRLIPEGATVKVCADSNQVVQGIKSWHASWAKRGWKKSDGKRPENLDIIQPMYELECRLNVIPVKEKGHDTRMSGSLYFFPYNRICDEIAENVGTPEAKTGATHKVNLIHKGKVVDPRAQIVTNLNEKGYGINVTVGAADVAADPASDGNRASVKEERRAEAQPKKQIALSGSIQGLSLQLEIKEFLESRGYEVVDHIPKSDGEVPQLSLWKV